ncbi:MAG: right-handed parallel beta-helix repeat-containing protein, partial [bacterium]|nr:right-handed parallel beta-helix repeat-containing protein [bacterium]
TLFDFRLKSGSPAIDAGMFLTKTVSAGSGIQIKVEDARHFFDGWGVTQGDLIQFQGQTQTARVIGADYSTNTITLDRGLIWTAGQGVSLAYKGNAPDIGTYEY